MLPWIHNERVLIVQWLRLYNGPPEPFENWTKTQASSSLAEASSADPAHALEQKLAQNKRQRNAVEDAARVIEQQRLALHAEHVALRAALAAAATQS